MTQAINTPLTLPCGVTLPNRLVKSAMTEGLADPLNRATDKHATLYRRWGKGGAGVLITGNVQVDHNYLERAGNIVIEGPQSPEQLAALRAMASAAAENGAHIWMQISHAGRQSPASVTKEPVAPSSVAVALPGGQFGKPRALEGSEIEDIINRFAYVATIARDTGFSGVQLHGAHGYLLSEFLSPRVNQRTDQWGGSLDNRARMLLQLVEKTRAAVGPDFPISVKLNSTDFQKGGFSNDECMQVVKWLCAAGVDNLEISGGNYEQPSMMGAEGLEPVFEEGVRQSTKAREAYFMDYAVRLRQVSIVPLMVTGGFRSRAAMNEAIDEDGIGLIGLARPLCAEPDCLTDLLAENVDRLPEWEKKLRFGPGILGPNSKINLIKAMNGWGAQGWCCLQILRMGEGLDPDLKMTAFQAFRKYQANETKAAAAMAL